MLNQQYTKAASPADFHRELGYGSETHCRCVWSPRYQPKEVSPWQYVGFRDKKGPTTTISAYSQETASRGHYGKEYSVDVCVSPNQFFNWRCGKQLAKLCANWIEIDVSRKNLSPVEEMAVIDDVLTQLKAAGIPAPTLCNSSGSGGWHIYWVYEPVDARSWQKRVWKSLTRHITDRLKGNDLWHVDPTATHDPARVLKIPGTMNSKTKRRVVSYLGGPRYQFLDLLESMGLETAPPPRLSVVNVKPKKSPEDRERAAKQHQTGKHNIKHWWQRTAWAVESHSRKHGVSEGKRDQTAFILYVALCHAMGDHDAAWQFIKQKNADFIRLDDAELESYLKTARTTQYKYRKDTLAAYLENIGIDSAYLYETGKVAPLPPGKIKAAQQGAALSTAEKKRKKTQDALRAALLRLGRKGVEKPTQKQIAHESGMSLSTVKRQAAFLREVKIQGVISSPSIYPPLLS